MFRTDLLSIIRSLNTALFLKFIFIKNSTRFGQIYCPSSGVSTLYTQQLVFVMLVILTVCHQTVNLLVTSRKQNFTHALCSLLSAIIKIAELPSRHLEKSHNNNNIQLRLTPLGILLEYFF